MYSACHRLRQRGSQPHELILDDGLTEINAGSTGNICTISLSESPIGRALSLMRWVEFDATTDAVVLMLGRECMLKIAVVVPITMAWDE